MKRFPCFLYFDSTKNKYVKGPLVPKGLSWQEAADMPTNDPTMVSYWDRAQVVGIPIPDDVVVVDLDTDKGITPDIVDQFIGAPVDWAGSHIQNTVSGGAHFAFKMPSWPVRQVQGLKDLPGFDTRIAGRGFICSGLPHYTPIGLGVERMADPSTLPVLPDQFKDLLIDTPSEPTPLGALQSTDQDTDLAALTDALKFIDPTERSTWFSVGCSLKAHDLPGMFELFDVWSSGALAGRPVPDGYNADTQSAQWNSFKTVKEGKTISRSTVYYLARAAGWTPPSSFDSAKFFQSSEEVSAVYMAIMEHGGNLMKTSKLVEDIRNLQGPDITRQLLVACLENQLTEANVASKRVKAAIEEMIKPDAPPINLGAYGPNDTVNAMLFLDTHYPDSTLCRADQDFYRFNGKVWEHISDEAIEHQVTLAMIGSRPSSARVSGCSNLVRRVPSIKDGELNRIGYRVMVCQNGVFDLETNMLHPHDPTLFTTNLLPFEYDPTATCPTWEAFLWDTLSEDQELVDMLQEWVGYLLTADYEHHKMMLFQGPPRSGKSTIGRIVRRLIGDTNFAGGSLLSFADDAFLEMIRRKSCVFISDAEKSLPRGVVEQVVARLKSISGNDEISYRRKFKSTQTETLPARIMIASNSVPRMFDDSGALSGRLLIIPFYKSFVGREDLNLEAKLLSELSGIANWAIQGWRRLKGRGRFTVSAASELERQYVHEQFSPLSQFISEECTMDPSARCSTRALYDAYKAWCVREGNDILSQKTFTAAFKESTAVYGVRYGTVRTDNDGRGRGFYGVFPRPAPQLTDAFKVVK